MFVILVHYQKPLSEVDKFIAEHRTFLKGYYDSGLLLMSGRQASQTGGVIVANGSKAEIEAMIACDPFKREKLAEYEIIEFSASLTAPLLAEFKV